VTELLRKSVSLSASSNQYYPRWVRTALTSPGHASLIVKVDYSRILLRLSSNQKAYSVVSFDGRQWPLTAIDQDRRVVFRQMSPTNRQKKLSHSSRELTRSAAHRRDSARRQSLRRSRSFKVTDCGSGRCDFLLVNNTNLHPVSHFFPLSRREAALQAGLVLPNVEDWNGETIFYAHYRSIFNHCDVIGQQSYRIR